MSNFKWGIRSLQRLSGVHPDLVAVCNRALEISEVDIVVLEGLRSRDRQRELFAKGASKTMNSRHLTGHAVDLAPWPIDWDDLPRFKLVADAMKQASEELGVPVIWGGDWRTFYDGPHFELDRKVYS
jgi:peptidoglycan LD-endopeptidase CwlK